MEEERDKEKEKVVLMWGYFPGVSSQRSPLLCLAVVRMPPEYSAGDSWRDISGGGGFTMAVSGTNSLILCFFSCKHLVVVNVKFPCLFVCISKLPDGNCVIKRVEEFHDSSRKQNFLLIRSVRKDLRTELN